MNQINYSKTTEDFFMYYQAWKDNFGFYTTIRWVIWVQQKLKRLSIERIGSESE